MNRLAFLKSLAGLPIVAALAPLAFSGQQEAQSVSGGYISAVSTLSSSGFSAGAATMGQEIEQLPPGQFAQPVGPAVGVFTQYATDEAGDWAGYIEAADKSWISFIDNSGASMAFRRTVQGLEKIAPLVGDHLPGKSG